METDYYNPDSQIKITQVARLLEYDEMMSDFVPLKLLISNNSSAALYSYYFDTSKTKDQLITGYLSAFNQIMAQIFDVEVQQPYNIMTFNENKIMIMRIDALYLFILFRGDEDGANQFAIQFIDALTQTNAWSNITRMSPRIYAEDIKEINYIVENGLTMGE